MDNFSPAYTAYYNLFYCDKNYALEAEYVASKIRNILPEAKKILDIGCGTGMHDVEFVKHGFLIHGIDRSENMITIAKQNESDQLHFSCCDALALQKTERFDAVVSLFHVISYITETEDLAKCFRNVNAVLTPGGVFIFDFWYGPAVLKQHPEKRVRVMRNEIFHVERIATPVMNEARHVVEVTFDISSLNHKTGQEYSFRELHPMRYFFESELTELLSNAGFAQISFEQFLTGSSIGENTWGVCCIARKERQT